MAGSAAVNSKRYVLREVIGKGGMGVVYRAYDNETRRDVTLKTLLDVTSPAMLELFRKECDVLSRLNHPNIVDIYDIGELLDADGKRQPYFVMPLLPGITLDRLIADASHRLNVERAIDIITQACRGLHAAHERGLIHRDIKPSNIFVLEDDSVKLIDFGVAHLTTGQSQTSVKGTLHYMSPEQLQAKKPTPSSDLFSLGVVCYEAITRRRPFDGANADEVVQAILNQIPLPASELNPAANRTLSQVIQKSLAKHPLHRFSSLRDFGENLQRAARGEAIEIFDEKRMLARLERAQRALNTGELEFAGEVLNGLESEGYAHPDLAPLRREIDRRQHDKTIGRLLDSARRCFREDEYQLALQKIQEILQIEPGQGEALTLQNDVENKRSSEQIGKWIALAQEHLENNAYNHARQALEDVLQLKPDHLHARKMLSLVEFQEIEYVRVRKQKEDHYQAAMQAWRKGEVSAALSELERVMSLMRQAPDTTDPSRASRYQNFYNQVRSDHDALKNTYEEARKRLSERDFKSARTICEGALAKYPGHALFQSLKVDVEEAQRQDLSAFIARVDREAEAEPDLDRRVSMLREALAAHPSESHFERALQLAISKRDLVASIVTKARSYEERRQFLEAINQWEMLRTIYAGYPGLSFELERLLKRRDQQARAEAKARWVQQIDQTLGLFEWARALDLVRRALTEFPQDGELQALEQLAAQGQARATQIQTLLERGHALLAEGQLDEAIQTLREAYALDDRDPAARPALIEALLQKARRLLETDSAAASDLINQVLLLEPGNTLAKTLRALLDDRKRDQFVDHCLFEARQIQASGRLDTALDTVVKGLAKHPGESRLLQLKGSLERSMAEQQRLAARRRDLEEVRHLEEEAKQSVDTGELRTFLERTVAIAAPYEGDKDFDSILDFLRVRLAATSQNAELALTAGSAPAPDSSVVAPHSSPALALEPPPVRSEAVSTRSRQGLALGIGAAAVLVVLGAVALFLALQPKPETTVRFQLTTEPAGAAVTVDGKAAGAAPFPIALPPGPHQVKFSLPGYKELHRLWTIGPGLSPPGVERLEALPLRLEMTSLAADAVLTLDGKPRNLPGPGLPLEIPELPLNVSHTLQISAAGGTSQFTFQAAPARIPDVEFQPATASSPVFILSAFGTNGRFYSLTKVKLSVDGGKIYRQAGADGLELSPLPEDGTLMVQEASGAPRTFEVAKLTSPAVQVFLPGSAAAALGSIAIDSAEADFAVLIDGQRASYRRKGPPYVLYNIPAGTHQVQIQKPGYRAEPAAFTAQVKPNQTTALKAALIALPTSLVVQGAIPETSLALGGRLLGATESGREFRMEIPPGTYELTLSKNGYKPKTLRRVVGLGDQWTVAAPESRLDPIVGTILVTKNNPGIAIRLTIRQNSGIPLEGPRIYEDAPAQLTLPIGSYTLLFDAPGYKPDIQGPLELVEGENDVNVQVKLDRR
ncbi:MAG: protein kinase [Acidobacteriia bacterium]|nr:protein kinase [Terriglobia bacterium]